MLKNNADPDQEYGTSMASPTACFADANAATAQSDAVRPLTQWKM